MGELPDGLIAAAGGYAAVTLYLLKYVWGEHKSHVKSQGERIEELHGALGDKVSREELQSIEKRLGGAVGKDVLMDHIQRLQDNQRRLEEAMERDKAATREEIKNLRDQVNGLGNRLSDRLDTAVASISARFDALGALMTQLLKEQK